ncbi:hypothetical protein HAX54_038446, partial [Datura stramonium]|nr:hypothetical protein [Datura stramonium]
SSPPGSGGQPVLAISSAGLLVRTHYSGESTAMAVPVVTSQICHRRTPTITAVSL